MTFLIAYAGAFACWGGFVYLLRRVSDERLQHIAPVAYVVAGLIALALLLMPPLMSTDSYRYLWDGGLIWSGINPYTTTPEMLGPSAVSESLFNKLDWKDQYTVYPPLAQIVFAGAFALYSAFGLWAGKLALASGAVAALWFLYQLVPLRIFLAALFNPLLLFESFNGAHVDAFVIAVLLAAYYFLRTERYITSSVLLASAVLLKLHPIIFVPLFAAEVWRRVGILRAVQYCAVCAAVSIAFFLPLFPYLSFLFERYNDWVREMVFNMNPLLKLVPQWVPITLLGAGVLFASTRRLSPATLLAVALLFIATSPVVYPWYTLVALPFLLLFAAEHERRYSLLYVCVALQLLFSLTYVNIYLFSAVSFEFRTAVLWWLAVAEYGLLGITACIITYKEWFRN